MTFPILDESLVDYQPERPGKGSKYPWDIPVGKSFFVPVEGDEEVDKVAKRLRNALSWMRRNKKIKANIQFKFKPHKQGRKLGVLAGRVK